MEIIEMALCALSTKKLVLDTRGSTDKKRNFCFLLKV